MDIQDFISNVSQVGLARVPNFRVTVTGPTQLGVRRDLAFKCNKVQFPGRSVAANEYVTYGPGRQVAVGSAYGTVDMSVYLSADFDEKKYFQKWQSLACGWATSNSVPGAGMFDIGYYTNYVGTVTVEQLDTTGAVTYSCQLIEAWPSVVSPLDADWAVDDIHRLGVTFAYRYFVDDAGSAQTVAPGSFDLPASA